MPLQRMGIDAGRVVPVTAQGRTTRDAIIRAALVEIEERGYLDARVDSITRCAGVAYGTFYKYFSGKRDLFRAALSEAFADIFRETERPPLGGSVADVVRATLTDRLNAYQRHHRALRVLDSAMGVDPALASLRNTLQREQVEAYAAVLAGTPGYSPVGSPLAVSFAVNALLDEAGRRLALSYSDDLAFPRLEVKELVASLVPMVLAIVAPATMCSANSSASADAGASASLSLTRATMWSPSGQFE